MAGVTVEKRGNTWRYRFDTAKIGGKRHRIQKGGFATKREAQAAGAAAFAEFVDGGVVFKPRDDSFSDYLDYWLDTYCIVNLKPCTITDYTNVIQNHIKPKVGMYKLTQLTPAVLQSVVTGMFNDGFARPTLKKVRGIMKKSLSYAVEPSRFLKDSPAIYLSLPLYSAQPAKPTRKNPHVVVPQDMIKKIFELYPEKKNAHIPLLLGYRCGMRRGEAYGVEISDIDFSKGTIHIRQQMQRDVRSKKWYMTAPKYNSHRIIRVDDETLAVLQRRVHRIEERKRALGDAYPRYFVDHAGYIQTTPTDRELMLLNVNDDGAIIHSTAINTPVIKIQEKLRFPEFDFHSLRHTHATMLAEAGAPVKFIQERLGHKSAMVTMDIYQHISAQQEELGAGILNSMFSGEKKEMPDTAE